MHDYNRIHRGNHDANVYFFEGIVEEGPFRILEIGCGTGPFLQYLIDQGHACLGIELDSKWLSVGRDEFGKLPFMVMQGEALGFESDSFDLVVSFDVLEHIPDTDKHLAEVRRVLKPGGAYLLQTPNMLTNIPFEIVKERSLCRWRQYHCSLHSYWGLRRRFEKHGFETTFHKIPVVTPFFRNKLRRYLGPLGPVLLKVINPDRFPMPLRTNFYVVARPTGEE